jgi:hypothetical protein
MAGATDALSVDDLKRAIMGLHRAERAEFRRWLLERFDVRGFILSDGVVVDPDEPEHAAIAPASPQASVANAPRER